MSDILRGAERPRRAFTVKRLLVVGDNLAAGHVAEDGTDNGWPVMLGIPQELRQGVDGTTAAQWAADVNGMLSHALATPCDAVLVCLGGNDAFAAWADKRITSDEVANVATNAAVVVNALMSKGVPVYVLLYANPWPTDWTAGLAVFGLNNTIAFKVPTSVEIVRASEILTLPEHWARNDFYPSYAGHRALAALIATRTGLEVQE